MKLVVGISGATGVIYGVRLLQALQAVSDIETHLVISEPAVKTLAAEMRWSLSQVLALADYHYQNEDIGARIASGSFRTAGMVVIPCSIKTLSAIAHSYDHNLMTRAADVTLKEGRKLVLVTRETPLHLGHLRLMTAAAEMGAVLLPPMPAFYHQPQSVQDIVDQTVGKVLDQFGIDNQLYRRWNGL
ncbi:3-octaprenyl-4-hydroxybenzoate carboxy-lyase [Propionispora sp. 2/2-37]|uniref:UbiX family flavin prenyltransferase n=1 Tax=Propionispora sp. 2/2-37 TaxID=1677858 RepID=UPI0006BB7C41|nr:UbiX family flavin prenyltransferase [Propionispora sp. 2/2-37]CUH96541.1 3-octaprenyl-4-hydroxybenzoate carboxy-lyase [Propionispora sp. 2/2-37]